MTKIAVVSDSHRMFRFVGEIRTQAGKIDWLLHAGDHMQDAERIATSLGVEPTRVRAVAGNCDYPHVQPTEQIVEIDGVRILMTHGHLFGVKDNYHRVYYRAREVGARVAVFGHTHMPVIKDDGVVLLLNPGSLSQPRLPGDPPSCALLEVSEGQLTVQIIPLA